MTHKAFGTSILAVMMSAALAAPAFAQSKDDKKDEKKEVQHCSPKIAELCSRLPVLNEIGEATWRVAAYGATACVNSKTVQTERKKRRDRLEYEERLEKAARDNKTEYTPWNPPESAAEFTARTNQQCDQSFTYYCDAMIKEAGEIADGTLRTDALDAVSSMCGGQSTADATPAPAANQ